MSTIAVLNREASSLKTLDADALGAEIVAAFGAQGRDVSVVMAGGEAIANAVGKAARDTAHDTLIVGGGDGTVSLAAGLAHKHGKVLGIIPGGNMNFFARSLGLPLEPSAAVEALAAADIRTVDIAFANGQPFVHEFSLGLHPELIADRDRQRYGSKLAKMLGTARSAVKLVLRPSQVRVWLDDGGVAKPVAVAALVVSNNPYGVGHAPYADRLDAGVLGVYLVRSRAPHQVAALAASLQTGNWQDLSFVECSTLPRLKLDHRRRMKTAIDGELVMMRGPVTIRIDPGGLRVLAPTEGD